MTAHEHRPGPNEGEAGGPGRALALDLATALARLQQLDGLVSAEKSDALAVLLWDRVISCDVPRLLGHLEQLDPQMYARLDELRRS